MFNPSQNLLGKFRCLSQKSDCSLFALAPASAFAVSANFVLAYLSSLYRFQGSLVAVALALTTLIIIPEPTRFVNNFFYFLSSYYIRIIPYFYPQENPPFFALNIPLTGTLLRKFTAGICAESGGLTAFPRSNRRLLFKLFQNELITLVKTQQAAHQLSPLMHRSQLLGRMGVARQIEFAAFLLRHAEESELLLLMLAPSRLKAGKIQLDTRAQLRELLHHRAVSFFVHQGEHALRSAL